MTKREREIDAMAERWSKHKIDAMTRREIGERWYEIEWLWADFKLASRN